MSGAHHYLIALGSNKRHHRFGPPERVLAEAAGRLGQLGNVEAVAPVIRSMPVGPSQRRFANGAVVLATALEPPALLASCKRLERDFGRTAGGQRWGARVLDCDIILWSGGAWHGDKLTIPHLAFRQRTFVLKPAVAIMDSAHDPVSGFTLRQLLARLTRPRPVPR